MKTQRKNKSKTVLLYLEEHTSCQHYISDFTSGFSLKKYESGKELSISLKKQFLVIFMQIGELEIVSELGEIKKICADEVCLLDYEKEYSCKVIKNAVFTLLYFEYPKIKCDKYSLLSLAKDKKELEDDIRILPILEPLKIFIENLNLYLKNKLMCRHLHDLKESEWLFIMRGFYTKQESVYFLEPVIDSLNDFVTIVKENYLQCNSVSELAEKCNMSEKTFTRRFKDYFKDTPKQWMLNEKAKYIKSELENSNLNVKEIANKFGFSSPAHLNNYYKKHFNTTPRKKEK
ncbi:putative Transcriptional regulator, AraC family [uncultured Paludibacter sp.]|uniref:Putative Transcriptional regulator, AraC family n=1 Tax=uncultured Paludibacter sp. TaxID=497635 RepID=A0A653A5V1_9BACT|nr:putative Transcriptional regulator, AraC family [uncultured Paludibacter sp.]